MESMPTQIKYSIVFPTYDPKNILGDWSLENKSKILDTINGRSDVELIEVRDVLGFGSAMNEGMRKSKGEYIFLVSDDISINYPYWFEIMALPNLLTSYRPVTSVVTEETMPDFTCICIPRNIYEKVGEFDPVFDIGYGFDDLDYYIRSRKAGFGFRVMHDQVHLDIKHRGGGTFRAYYNQEEIDNMTRLNRGLFVAKHSIKL